MLVCLCRMSVFYLSMGMIKNWKCYMSANLSKLGPKFLDMLRKPYRIVQNVLFGEKYSISWHVLMPRRRKSRKRSLIKAFTSYKGMKSRKKHANSIKGLNNPTNVYFPTR